MNKKKSIYSEKINKDKSENEVKKDLMDLVIPHFFVDTVNKSFAINNIAVNNPIFGKYIPYFYLNMT
jgi:hypothetical protein